MPVYDYECEKCHFQFELKRRFGEDGTANCPRCRGKSRRIFTSVPVIFKGSGFYVTDHRKGGVAKSGTEKPPDKAPDSPPKKD
ncbi:MAG: hypothetical protein JW856_01925 [Dehalococcoidales bacterium]|nr:hypothetical protein [Dehalococcoidales bacterium]